MHYSITILICIFLIITIILFILIARSALDYVRHAPQDLLAIKRPREYLIVLLTYCMTQEFGWTFGLLVFIKNSQVPVIFGWELFFCWFGRCLDYTFVYCCSKRRNRWKKELSQAESIDNSANSEAIFRN